MLYSFRTYCKAAAGIATPPLFEHFHALFMAQLIVADPRRVQPRLLYGHLSKSHVQFVTQLTSD